MLVVLGFVVVLLVDGLGVVGVGDGVGVGVGVGVAEAVHPMAAVLQSPLSFTA